MKKKNLKIIVVGSKANDQLKRKYNQYITDRISLKDEKILNTDLRKVGVVVKKAYTSNQVLTPVTVYYRVYVKEGQTEVQVQDWTQVNRASNEYYFIFDTARNTYNRVTAGLRPNDSAAENTNLFAIDVLSNGFKVRDGGGLNGSGDTTIYAAFAEFPFKFSLAR